VIGEVEILPETGCRARAAELLELAEVYEASGYEAD
jgi:hypothetical protein